MPIGTTRITYDELGKLLITAHKFIERTNAEFNERFKKESLSVGDSSRSINIDGPLQLESLKVKEMPNASSFVSYSFRSSDSNAPITDLKIDLRDAYRTVAVEGNNSEQVDALFSLLKDEMENYSFIWGGPTFRLWSGFLFIFLFCLVPVLFMAVASELIGKELTIAVFVVVGIQFFLVLFLPFNKWLPGFVVYDPNLSFLVKYSPLFTFLGVIALPIGWIVTLLKKGTKKLVGDRKKNEQKMVRIESKIESTMQRVEEIKRNPPIAAPGELAFIEEEVRRLADEFFNTRDAKMLAKKRSDLDMEVRDAGLNAEWRPLYIFIIETLKMLLSSYNEKLERGEAITYELPDMPLSLFSAECKKYSGVINFANGVSVKIRFIVSRSDEENLPFILIDFDCKPDSMKNAELTIAVDPLKKSIRFRKNYGGGGIGINTDEQALIDNNYRQIIIEFLHAIIEPQLIS